MQHAPALHHRAGEARGFFRRHAPEENRHCQRAPLAGGNLAASEASDKKLDFVRA
jgi:hypothetical protein